MSTDSYISLLDSVPNLTEALERCFRLGGFEPKQAAYGLGVEYCNFVRMFRSGSGRYFPPDLILALMRNAGNVFPLDWLERRTGRVAYPREFMEILDGIKEALRADNRAVNFSAEGLCRH